MRIDILSLFPEMFSGPFGDSIIKRASDRGILDIHFTNPRDFAYDKHKQVDDSPFGGGSGMVLKPEPMFRAVRAVREAADFEKRRILLMCPSGSTFSQEKAKELADISIRPDKGRYKALCVNQNDVVDGNDCWVRVVDTEYKILEEMVAHLPDTKVNGRVKLYTDLPPCASCWNVILQFMAEYPNIQMQVLYKQK